MNAGVYERNDVLTLCINARLVLVFWSNPVRSGHNYDNDVSKTCNKYAAAPGAKTYGAL